MTETLTYTVTQLSEILQLTPATIRHNARNGSWPYRRFGARTIRFTHEDLTTILDTSLAQPPEPTTPARRRRRRTT
jgi:DNA-binding transcriptional MerR regulator